MQALFQTLIQAALLSVEVISADVVQVGAPFGMRTRADPDELVGSMLATPRTQSSRAEQTRTTDRPRNRWKQYGTRIDEERTGLAPVHPGSDEHGDSHSIEHQAFAHTLQKGCPMTWQSLRWTPSCIAIRVVLHNPMNRPARRSVCVAEDFHASSTLFFCPRLAKKAGLRGPKNRAQKLATIPWP